MDPITIMAGATAAFNAIKQGIQVGRDLQDMSGQLSQWAGAMSDLGRAETKIVPEIVLEIGAQVVTVWRTGAVWGFSVGMPI